MAEPCGRDTGDRRVSLHVRVQYTGADAVLQVRSDGTGRVGRRHDESRADRCRGLGAQRRRGEFRILARVGAGRRGGGARTGDTEAACFDTRVGREGLYYRLSYRFQHPRRKLDATPDKPISGKL